MAKVSGGTRNYAGKSTFAKREEEFNSLLATGMYDSNRSELHPSGGFYITHNDHNKITDHQKDKSDLAVKALAAKGYKVYLDSEQSTVYGVKMRDGRIYTAKMDIKTINEVGKNTIKGRVEYAAKQGAEIVVLYQNTTAMDKKYVKQQIDLIERKSPMKTFENIKMIIVVGANGHIHRHDIVARRQK